MRNMAKIIQPDLASYHMNTISWHKLHYVYHNVWFSIKACVQNKTQHCSSSAYISGYDTFWQGADLKCKQTTVLDKSGHGWGRFNEIKANRIPTKWYM